MKKNAGNAKNAGKSAIERVQSQTGLGYAEREQIQRSQCKDVCLTIVLSSHLLIFSSS